MRVFYNTSESSIETCKLYLLTNFLTSLHRVHPIVLKKTLPSEFFDRLITRQYKTISVLEIADISSVRIRTTDSDRTLLKNCTLRLNFDQNKREREREIQRDREREREKKPKFRRELNEELQIGASTSHPRRVEKEEGC